LVLAFFGDAVADFEACVVCRGMVGNGYAFYVSQRRRIILEFRKETLQVFAFSLNFDFDILGGVAHPAFQAVFGSQLVNERPEANSLNYAASANPG
jgi:hypothetical protein